jgi:hypothetical protein
MEQEGRQKLVTYLDGIAESQLAARKQVIAQIHTAAEADRRKAMVREKLLTRNRRLNLGHIWHSARHL